VSRYRAAYFDPAGPRYGGCPTWPWRCSPPPLMTRRQLAAHGLRPGRQPIAGQVLCRGRGGIRVAYLYDVGLALPRRHPSPRHLAALDEALAARRRCPSRDSDVGYCIPRSLGECLHCHQAARLRWAA